MPAVLPPNENERLQALQRYAILDTPPEAAFDRIVSLTIRLLQVPIALVTLVDENRQWFKACYGVDIRETSRELSFCAYTILSDEIMIVPDATQDARFADHPMVKGPPYVRFYAGIPLKDGNGFNLGTLCAIDTQPREFNTDQQLMLQDLAEIAMDQLHLRLASLEKKQLMSAIMSMSSAMIVTDPNQADNPIIFCNPAFTETSGYSIEEVLGRNCRFLQGPESDSAVLDKIRSAIKEQRTFSGLLLNYRKDRTPYWHELTITPVFDQDGYLANFVGVQNDVTERKRAEDALKESFDKLQQLESLRDNLTNMIIHDMRSPLTAVTVWLDVLKSRTSGRLDKKEVKAIEHVAEGADQLNLMITSLLDVSRLESGKMPIDISEYNLTELTRTAIGNQLALADSVRLKFESPAEPMIVRCDENLVARVIKNLVENALKFTPKHGEVCVRIDKEGSSTRLSVIDTGPGIPRNYHVKVFEKFEQVDENRHVDSTGLGLTFCKLAVEAQGGAIGVESEVGHGSTFWFSLP